jgi:hypothetical protein
MTVEAGLLTKFLASLGTTAAKKGARKVLGPSREQVFEEVRTKAVMDTMQIAYMVARALTAATLRRPAGDDEVSALLESALEGPEFYPRFSRLIGEAVKSTSTERRKLLSAAFFGLPLVVPDTGSRARVDAAVERLFPEDVRLLGELCRLEADLSSSGPFGPNLCICNVGKRDGTAGRVVPRAIVHDDAVQSLDIETSAYPLCSEVALAGLESTGCVKVHSPVRVRRAVYTGALIATDAAEGTMSILTTSTLEISQLGRLVAKCFSDERMVAATGVGEPSEVDRPPGAGSATVRAG